MKTRLVLIVETDPLYHTNPWEWEWSELLLTKAYVDSYDILDPNHMSPAGTSWLGEDISRCGVASMFKDLTSEHLKELGEIVKKGGVLPWNKPEWHKNQLDREEGNNG